MQILLTIAYDGTHYSGWQRQINGMSVQQKLEDALAALFNRPVILRAASRTDAGVHALGQRAAFDSGEIKIPLDKLPRVINGCLPKDISVTGLAAVSDDFNPRHAAYKTYHYQIYNAPCPNPLLARYAAFVPQSLDIAAMKKAASYFIGRFDFKAFCAVGTNGSHRGTNSSHWGTSCSHRGTNNSLPEKSAIREIFGCHVMKDGPLVTVSITGNGFLYNMVRIITGTLMYAGMGKIVPEAIPGIIASRERANAGKTMPPEGLTLMEVVY
jgi:tRNA pseudouridine38-40 synthase